MRLAPPLSPRSVRAHRTGLTPTASRRSPAPRPPESAAACPLARLEGWDRRFAPGRSAPRSLGPIGALGLLVSCAALIGCAAGQPGLRAELPALEAPRAAAPVDRDHFTRDKTGGIAEEHLRELITAPVYLAEDTRLGILPVAVAYEADPEVPVTGVPGVLAESLDQTGFFQVASEVSADWPSNRSVAGLRELAARYQTRYLLLYRHRFVERSHTNAWSVTWFALVTIPIVPAKTLETAGVLEATLFDVRTGTLLFTVYERVYAVSDENVWGNERKLRAMRQALVKDGAEALAGRVVHQVQRLAAARPAPAEDAPRAALR